VPLAAALPASAPASAPRRETASPLRLAPPPGGRSSWPPRSPALDDPRANSRPPTLESRIAGAMGDGTWSVEMLSDGRRRYRRGSDCVVVQPPRSLALDPFNGAVYKPPSPAGPC